VLTYALETRAETTYTQQLLQTAEMKIIRAIHGKRLRDKIRSDQLQQLSGIQDIVKWVNVRRREWDVHVNRMEGQPSGKDRQR
jgi:stage III sporulation protein SpoIIIAA